jgi:poly-gamma-glutamate system protein
MTIWRSIYAARVRLGRFPKDIPKNHKFAIYILCGLSVVFFVLLKRFPQKGPVTFRNEMIQASKIMRDATEALKECRLERGLRIDRNMDINATGLIGMEHSEITTSIGSLGSKRTSTNPNFAGLVVRLLRECDIQKGDAVAVGASGSFPALIVASLAALEALDLNPIWISSLGASQWGANHPQFHWLHMWQCLEKSGLFSHPPLALSLGGEGDTGEDIDEKGRQLLWDDIRRSGLCFLNEPDLARNVALRMALFEKAAKRKEIKAFINIGGSLSNMGIDSMVLHVKPGLNRIEKFPSLERRGVIYAMAAKEIPVIHLLYVRGLTQRYGLPWDPSPIPDPGEGALYRTTGERQKIVPGLEAAYVILVLLVLVLMRKRGSLVEKK